VNQFGYFLYYIAQHSLLVLPCGRLFSVQCIVLLNCEGLQHLLHHAAEFVNS